MSDADDDKALRRELTEACANVRRQIEVQRASRSIVGAGYGPGPSGSESAIDALRAELEELEDALANLNPVRDG